MCMPVSIQDIEEPVPCRIDFQHTVYDGFRRIPAGQKVSRVPQADKPKVVIQSSLLFIRAPFKVGPEILFRFVGWVDL